MTCLKRGMAICRENFQTSLAASGARALRDPQKRMAADCRVRLAGTLALALRLEHQGQGPVKFPPVPGAQLSLYGVFPAEMDRGAEAADCAFDVAAGVDARGG